MWPQRTGRPPRHAAVAAAGDCGPTSAARPALLEVDDLALRFGGVAALRGVSFAIRRGTISSIIGPNGAGKTTIFNCIGGFYRPDRGRIVFNGEDLVGRRPHEVAARGIARTFQATELFARMSTLDNLLLGRHSRMRVGLLGSAARVPGAVREELRHRERVEQIIDFLGLQAVRHRVVGTLPYGTRKLVELGRALAMEPELLLLDEPSAGMNAEEKADVMLWLQTIRDELGVTILLVEHDMGLVMRISERVIVLNDGVTIAEGPPAEVQRHPEVLRAYLGENGPRC
jgi:branched-chain amino acid transport system ATP-binding protein